MMESEVYKEGDLIHIPMGVMLVDPDNTTHPMRYKITDKPYSGVFLCYVRPAGVKIWMDGEFWSTPLGNIYKRRNND